MERRTFLKIGAGTAGAMLIPAMRVRDFNFTSLSDAV